MSNRAAVVWILLVAGLDRLTKWLIVNRLIEGASISVIPGFLSITHVRNPGAAFGFLSAVDSFWRDAFLVVVALVAALALGWMLLGLPREQRWQRAATVGVIGGALGNLYDRLAYGQVVDFVDAYLGSWHWPAFNVADSCITLGVVALVLASLFGGGSKENDGPASN